MNNLKESIDETGAKLMVKGTNTAVKLVQNRKTAKILKAVVLAGMMMSCMAITVFADESSGEAEQVMSTMTTEITKWVKRIGGVVVVFGGVNAGLGVANQDDAGRNRGFMTMAGGAILIAVTALLENMQL